MSESLHRSCPVCKSADIRTIGEILHPRPAFVAGVELELGDEQFWLRECRQCGFQFKDPIINQARLMECYAKASSHNWDIDPDPLWRQFDVLEAVAKRHANGRRVLDIGCFNGAMLTFFDTSWEKFGIEPSRDAVKLAESRGVRVLGASLDEFDRSTGAFDVILAIDVVEHIVEPLPFFQRVSELLAPNGIFVILTGDNQAIAWRLQGGNYWYSSLPEHVSFYSQKSLDEIGRQTGMAGVEYRRVCHKRLPFRRWAKDMVKSAAYIGGRATRGFGVPALRRLFVERRGPSIQAAHDHLIYVFRRK